METTQREETPIQRVRRELMAYIDQMNLEEDTRLPAEKKLSVQLQVSRSTLRSVLTELETEGKLIRKHGSGTYVNPPALRTVKTPAAVFRPETLIEKNGFTASVQTFPAKEVNAEERGSRLELHPYDRLLEVRSVFSAGGRPCIYCMHYLDVTRFSPADWSAFDQGNRSVYDYLQQVEDVLLTWDTMALRASDSNRITELREYFSVPKGMVKPVLRLEIVSYDSRNHPTLLGYAYVDTDHIKLDLTRDLSGAIHQHADERDDCHDSAHRTDQGL